MQFEVLSRYIAILFRRSYMTHLRECHSYSLLGHFVLFIKLCEVVDVCRVRVRVCYFGYATVFESTRILL